MLSHREINGFRSRLWLLKVVYCMKSTTKRLNCTPQVGVEVIKQKSVGGKNLIFPFPAWCLWIVPSLPPLWSEAHTRARRYAEQLKSHSTCLVRVNTRTFTLTSDGNITFQAFRYANVMENISGQPIFSDKTLDHCWIIDQREGNECKNKENIQILLVRNIGEILLSSLFLTN